MPRSIAGLVLAALLPFPAFAAVKNPDTLVVAEVGEPTSMDPAFPYEAESQGILYNIYETLIAYDGPSLTKMVPVLATAVPSLENGGISRDGLRYTFHIREGVHFHDGSTMTPDDVRYSLLRFMLSDPDGGPASLLLEPILGVGGTRDAQGNIVVTFKQAADAVTVRGDDVVIHLKRPYAPFLSIMARWSYVMSRSWAAAQGDWDGGEAAWKNYNNPKRESEPLFEKTDGTGPFKLERWDRQTKRVYLERNDAYWRKPAAIARAVFMTVPELATRKLMLEAGDADFADVPRPYLSQVQGLPGVRVADGLRRLTTDPVFFFTFNVNPVANPDIGDGKLDGDGIPPDFFSDPDVRKGFEYAFDYGAFIQSSYKGKAVRAKGVIPPGLFGFDPKQPCYIYDPEKAIQHFKKAWGGEVWQQGFTFTMSYNTGGEVRELACEVLKHGIESLSPKFVVNIRGLDWPSYLDKTQARKMPLFVRGWIADYPDANDFVFPFYDSQGRYAIAQGFSDPDMDRWIEQALRAVDPRERRALYDKIQSRAYGLAPQLTTIQPDGVAVMRSWVQGFTDNPIFMGLWLYPLSK